MKSPNRRAALAGVAILAGWLTTPSAYAQSTPHVESSAPGVGMLRVAPSLAQPSAAAPDAAPANEGAVGVTAPPADARRETLEDCISFWDPGTHMSKAEWRATCERTLNGQLF